ncbi:MAG: MFS transporter [SAR86 cluster bacterium]|uniref:MFS transporter n=1 Tax=SAR86 cluster bacterium TaxID=2030880 RepID=A0A2A4MGC4_9GAMM|nr:MAG: MFS transporter [SAR86 cluster bacterium]
MEKVESLTSSLSQLKDRRFLSIFLFGFCSGFPWVLHGSVLTLWLQQSGMSRSTIGYFAVVGTAYALNWIWAPFVDKLRIPFLFKLLGQRRSWILLCQGGIAVFVFALSTADPTENLLLVSLFALGIAVFSATLDVSVDAYRISIFSAAEADAKIPYAAAVSTAGYYAGFGFLGGAMALALGGETIGLAWSQVYLCLLVVYLVLMALVFLTPTAVEEEAGSDALQQVRSIGQWFMVFVIEPFREFFNRCGFKLAFSILAFLILFRLGEAMLGRMSMVFYVELGFSVDQISVYQKFFGGIMTALFSLLGAVVNTRFGVIKGLFIGGSAMALANLLFAVMAVVGPNVNLLMVTLLIDNFCTAFATVATISFISYFTSRTYTGTQYALMASISNLGKTSLAAGSGALVDFLGGNWSLFFILTTLMVIPSLCFLVWIAKLLEQDSMQRSSKQP